MIEKKNRKKERKKTVSISKNATIIKFFEKNAIEIFTAVNFCIFSFSRYIYDDWQMIDHM